MTQDRRYWIGTSGWVYQHWRRVFYPPDLKQNDWFRYYAERFATVEVNNTFYRLPSEQACKLWRAQAPAGFRYAVKGSRYITHVKRLADADGAVDLFMRRAALLGPRLGPLLWQLPPTMRRDDKRLAAFIDNLPRGVEHVFEFRRDDWFCDEVFDLLRARGAGFCAYHRGRDETPFVATSRIAYLRFHGTTSRYGGTYRREQLESWALRLLELPQDVREAYIYFNNDVLGAALRNAIALRGLLREAGADAP